MTWEINKNEYVYKQEFIEIEVSNIIVTLSLTLSFTRKKIQFYGLRLSFI